MLTWSFLSVRSVRLRRNVVAVRTQPMNKPEYTTGDVVEVFNPETKSLVWIEVEEVLNVNGAQVLKSSEGYFCACLVNVESLAFAGTR
jgi:hypothetical protein